MCHPGPEISHCEVATPRPSLGHLSPRGARRTGDRVLAVRPLSHLQTRRLVECGWRRRMTRLMHSLTFEMHKITSCGGVRYASALVLDSRRGSELLKMAIDDGHPHVRAAATKALQTSRAPTDPPGIPAASCANPWPLPSLRSDGHDTHFG